MDYDPERGTEQSKESRDETIGTRQRGLPWTRKAYEFYNAPIVKFWFHTVCCILLITLQLRNSAMLIDMNG